MTTFLNLTVLSNLNIKSQIRWRVYTLNFSLNSFKSSTRHFLFGPLRFFFSIKLFKNRLVFALYHLMRSNSLFHPLISFCRNHSKGQRWQTTCVAMSKLLSVFGLKTRARSVKTTKTWSRLWTTTCSFLTPSKRTCRVLGRNVFETETSPRKLRKTWSSSLTTFLMKTRLSWTFLKTPLKQCWMAWWMDSTAQVRRRENLFSTKLFCSHRHYCLGHGEFMKRCTQGWMRAFLSTGCFGSVCNAFRTTSGKHLWFPLFLQKEIEMRRRK